MLSRLKRLLNSARRKHPSQAAVTSSPASAVPINFETQLERARAAWMKEMAAFVEPTGCVSFPAAPMLTEEHTANCRLLPSREAILDRIKPGGVLAEVGVQTGRFSRTILSKCRPVKLHLIDINLQAFQIADKFKPEIATGQVVLHEGDSSLLLQEFAHQYFDMIYVDANHSYQGVKRDIEAAKTKLKPDGWFVFNDYTFWSAAECMPYGVIQAVNELCLEGWELVYFALAHYMYCDVVVRRRQ